MNTLNTILAARLTSRGIHPDLEIPADEPFDPVAWRIANYRARLAADLPHRFATAEATHPDVLAWIQAHLTRRPDAKPALLLTGNTGVGKTWQAYGALRQLIDAAAHANRRYRWKITTHPDLNAELRPRPDNTHTEALDPYLECDALVLDDIGAGKQTDWTGDNLTRLVDHRWANNQTTIYSTNLAAETLRQAVGDRIVSRLSDTTVAVIDGPDRRWASR